MERNINGYPESRGGNCSPDTQSRADGCMPDSDATLGDRLLAYAYVPVQRFRMLHPTETALSRGTLFVELDKPMEVYGNE